MNFNLFTQQTYKKTENTGNKLFIFRKLKLIQQQSDIILLKEML